MSRLLPKNIREIRAKMELKGLTLADVASGLNALYAECSRVLRGGTTTPAQRARLKAIRHYVYAAPEPEEVAA